MASAPDDVRKRVAQLGGLAKAKKAVKLVSKKKKK